MKQVKSWKFTWIALVIATLLCPCIGMASAAPSAIEGLLVENSLELKYASGFSVDYLTGGYKLIADGVGRQFMLVPEGAQVPAVGEAITVLQAPLTSIGCFSTTHAVLFKALNQLDKITLVTSDRGLWHMEQIQQQMDAGTTVYVGKKSAPDYEKISALSPQLTLITANSGSGPDEVLSKFDELNIPWFASLEHLENTPLGRLEWVKLAGALLGVEEEAEAFFNEREQKILAVAAVNASVEDRPTVNQPFIFKGVVYIRNDDDYVNGMIDMAGGANLLKGIAPDKTGTTTISIEDYYQKIIDVDCMIYDTTSDQSVKTIRDIVANGEYLKDIKAIKDGNVWGIQPHYYQNADDVATMVEELHTILYDPDNATDLKYYFKLEA